MSVGGEFRANALNSTALAALREVTSSSNQSPTHMKQHRALALLAVAAIVTIIWLAREFATGILLGALLAFTLEPLYRKLIQTFKRDFIAAFAVVLSTAVIIVGAIAGFATLFVTRAAQVANAAREALKPGGPLHTWVDAVAGW